MFPLPIPLWWFGTAIPHDLLVLHQVVSVAGAFVCIVYTVVFLVLYTLRDRSRSMARAVVGAWLLFIAFMLLGLYLIVVGSAIAFGYWFVRAFVDAVLSKDK